MARIHNDELAVPQPHPTLPSPASGGGQGGGLKDEAKSLTWPPRRYIQTPLQTLLSTPQSMPPRSTASPGSPENGGTLAERWRCCIRSIQCGSPTSAMRCAGSSVATPAIRLASTASAFSILAAAEA